MTARASAEAVAAKLREMGVTPERADALARIERPKPLGRSPSVAPEMLIGASADRLRELATEAGVRVSSLYGLRRRHLDRKRARGWLVRC